MPHFKIRGLDKKILVENSKELIDNVASIVSCPREWVTLEHQETEYIFDGKIIEGYTFIEIYWFAREEKIKKALADFLVKFFKAKTNDKDTCVIFFTLEGENYCDNGDFF